MGAIELRIPILEIGKIYEPPQLRGHICVDNKGNNDYSLANASFPMEFVTFEPDPMNFRPNEFMVVQYQVLPLCDFETQIRRIVELFERNDELRDNGKVPRSIEFRPETDRDRIRLIVEKLHQGEVIYPAFIQQNDPQLRIIEGMHRTLALKQLKWGMLPVLFTGYRDWF